MTEPLVIVLVADLGPLALTPAALREARARGRELLSEPQAPPSKAIASPERRLLTADELAECTGIKSDWWMAGAREHRVPHVRIGRQVRFQLDEVLASDAVKRRAARSSVLVHGSSIRGASPSA